MSPAEELTRLLRRATDAATALALAAQALTELPSDSPLRLPIALAASGNLRAHARAAIDLLDSCDAVIELVLDTAPRSVVN